MPEVTASSRGIVIAPHYIVQGKGLLFPGLAGIEAADLRFYLLYWDRLDFPDSNLIRIGNTADVDFLLNVGVMARSRISFTGSVSDFPGAYVTGQMAVLRSREEREPGLWTLAQSGSRFELPSSEEVVARTIEFDLYKALPVPPETVALDDVLQFKNRRREQLLDLRAAMDDLYLRATESSDVARATRVARDSLERKLVDLHRVLNETWPNRLLASLKVELRIQDMAAGAAIGNAFGESIGLTRLAGMAAGAAAATLRFEPRNSGIRGLPESLRAFAYVAHVEKDLK